MNDQEFVDFVERYFESMECEISLDDKIRVAFGSMDNALYESEKTGNAPRRKRNVRFVSCVNAMLGIHTTLWSNRNILLTGNSD